MVVLVLEQFLLNFVLVKGIKSSQHKIYHILLRKEERTKPSELWLAL